MYLVFLLLPHVIN